MADPNTDPDSRRAKVEALADVARFDPMFSALIVVLGIVVAVLEGVGLSFILPIIELVRAAEPAAEAGGPMALFVTVYRALGVPFTLGYVIAGVAFVIGVRYTTGFVAAWFREALRTYYTRHLQLRAFENTLDTRIGYFDEEGSDDIINAIITQTFYAGRVIKRVVQFFQLLSISVVYLLISLAVAPLLAVLAIGILGTITVVVRRVVQPGYSVGDRIADANELRQEAVQAGTEGIREVRLLGLAEELYDDFVRAVDQFTDARIALRRNEAAIDNFYNLTVSVAVFVLIYAALAYANLSLGELGLFLFAMFQLGPKVSRMNEKFYQVENDLPHLVRTQAFLRRLEEMEETDEATRDVPAEVETVAFDDVWFSYDDESDVLRGIDFEVERGEFVAFVGQSGAGKSTIVSLLARFYEADRGEITANGAPITEMPADEWRERIAVVRQNPFVFDDTLRYNLTAGNRAVSQREIDRACEIARVDEFFGELADGYETQLGTEGVRLSGGQKQRVAIARALLTDADVLILDEATSDLDSNLERDVQEAIEAMDRDYAMITIAHQLSTIKNADRIHTVENGRIVESGTHEELLAEEGEYADLYTVQLET